MKYLRGVDLVFQILQAGNESLEGFTHRHFAITCRQTNTLYCVLTSHQSCIYTFLICLLDVCVELEELAVLCVFLTGFSVKWLAKTEGHAQTNASITN